MKVSLVCILIRIKSVTSTPTRTESDATGKEESPYHHETFIIYTLRIISAGVIVYLQEM